MDQPHDIQQRKDALPLTPQEETALADLRARIGAVIGPLLASFEHARVACDELQVPLEPAARQALRDTLTQALERLLQGPLDHDYEAMRREVGARHARLGISPVWYLGAYGHLFSQLCALASPGDAGGASVATCQALIKAAMLDLGFALDGYVAHRDARTAELRDQEAAFACLPHATLVVTEALDIVFANPAFAALWGAPPALQRDRPLDDVLDTTPLQPLVQQACAGMPAQELLHLTARDATLEVPALVTLQPLHGPAAGPGGQRLLMVIEDRRAQAQLARDLLNAQSVAGIGTWQMQEQGLFELTPQAARLLGWHEGRPASYDDLLACLHPQDRARVDREWQAALRSGSFREEFRVQTNQRVRWVEVRGVIEFGPQQQPRLAHGTVLDITERKRAEHTMERLAFFDTLTGLPNRTNGTMLAQRLVEHARTLQCTASVLYVDLDRFKDINEAHGQAVGDAVLLTLARRLRSSSRDGDVLCRLGSDEFVCVHLREAGEAPETHAERIATAIAAPFTVENLRFQLQASIGIAHYPEHGDDIDLLLQQANTAMSEAKLHGGGLQTYSAALGERLQRRVNLGTRLAAALADGRLQLYYQPKVHLDTGLLSGAEALARWYDPEWGWISPAEFVPVAEERGLVSALGDWALSRAAADLQAWQREGVRRVPRIAVNVSAAQMMDDSFPDRAAALVHAHGGQTGQIELELTESALMNDPDRARAVASRLVAAGFSLSIDDFGTGYSSLARLQGFPVEQLKIDMSFVRTMVTDTGSRAIVATIIGMARALGLKTVAEGVEETAQADALRALQCDQAQGYLYARPLPAQTFWEQWLR